MGDGSAPVVIRRWVSGRPRGVPHLEVVCDESGFSGGNLVGGHAPVFAHASVRIDGATAAALIADLRRRMDGGPRGELKANALLRPQHRHVVHDLLGPKGPLAGTARVHLVDTVYFALARLADILSPDADADADADAEAPRGTDSPGRDPAARHAARVLRARGPETYGPDRWHQFLVRAADLMRTNSRWTAREPVAPFAAALDELIETPGEVADILRPMRARLPVAVAVRAALKADPKLATLLEPVVPALARAVAMWAPAGGTLSVIHDDQSAVTPERVAAIAAGTGLVEVTLVDSRTDPRVQVADLLAGVARRVAGEQLAVGQRAGEQLAHEQRAGEQFVHEQPAGEQRPGQARPDDDLAALLGPFVDPESVWSDARSWSTLSPDGIPLHS